MSFNRSWHSGDFLTMVTIAQVWGFPGKPIFCFCFFFDIYLTVTGRTLYETQVQRKKIQRSKLNYNSI